MTSIKEYGAFVEFNGGQQGLLHMSELSHEPVSLWFSLSSSGKLILSGLFKLERQPQSFLFAAIQGVQGYRCITYWQVHHHDVH